MSLPNPGWNVVYGEQPTAAKWSELGANDDALAAGTGLNVGAVTAEKMSLGTIFLGEAVIGGTGKSITNTSFADVGLAVSATIPNGVTKVRLTFADTVNLNSGAAGNFGYLQIVDGASTVVAGANMRQAASIAFVITFSVKSPSLTVTPGASKTYKLQAKSDAGSISMTASGLLTLEAVG